MSIFGRRRADYDTAAAGVDPSELPQAAMAFCAAHRLHPNPAVYETVYAYLGGAVSALSLAMSAELARGPLTHHGVMRLRDEHLPTGKMVQSISDIGAGLGREVEDIGDVLDEGIEAGAFAKAELARLTDTLERAPTRVSLFEQAGEIREIGLRQLATNMKLRETLRLTRNRLDTLERDLAKHMEEANTDHLSKLPNRRAIDSRLASTFARPAIASGPCCLVMVDIDHFKTINDTHGHDIGDSVIRLTADILRRDVAPKGYAARWGGEEFAILLDRAGLRDARLIAETVRRSIEAARWTRRKDGVALGVITASFGIAERRADDTMASLAKRADAALYRAKSEGRNRCVADAG